MDASFADRRKYRRIPMVSFIRVKVEDESFRPAMLVDLSPGGARVLSQFEIPRESSVKLEFSLASGENIEVEGEVAWARRMDLMREHNFGIEHMSGIKFNEINDTILRLYNSYPVDGDAKK